VGGHRLSAERRLDGSPDVRFGGVKVIFRGADDDADVVHGTRPITSVDRTSSRPAARSTRVQTESTPATSPAGSQRGLAPWVWIVVGLAILAAGAIYTLNR
jgi:hypothetical protein